jgi:hypothetical protein
MGKSVAGLLAGWAVCALPGTGWGADILVSSAADIAAALPTIQPGDVLVMNDGTWTDQVISFAGNGSASAPITLRAKTPGRVILNGTSRLTISGQHLVVDGLTFRGGALSSSQHIVRFTGSLGDARNCRLTNSAFIDYNPASSSTRYFWVSVDGENNRVDRNFFHGQNHSGVTVVVWPKAGVTNAPVIENNHFTDRPVGTGNGFETIRIGTSDIQTHSTRAIVQSNLFERTDGEMETISNKTSDNIFRYNTYRDVEGTLTLRHGRGARVEGNFFLGTSNTQTGGIRVIGPDHVVINNYLADLGDRADGAIAITSGQTDFNVAGPNSNGYEPVTNVQIVQNTIVNVRDAAIRVDALHGDSTTQTVRPSNVTIANNAIWSTRTSLIQGTVGSGFTWAGNMVFGASLGISARPGITTINPQLVRDAATVFRPTGASPLINGGASGAWTSPTDDMDGQARVGTADVGADEWTLGQAGLRRPLSASDVGPGWLKRRTMAPYHGLATTASVLAFEAEDYTALYDNNADTAVWTAIAGATGAVMRAPAGARIDIPGMAHDSVLEYDVAFHDAGTYILYAFARGFDASSDSIWVSNPLGGEASVNRSVSSTGLWAWTDLGSFSITAANTNVPLTLRIGRREQNVEIDRFVFLSSRPPLYVVPEPACAGVLLGGSMLLLRRRR